MLILKWKVSSCYLDDTLTLWSEYPDSKIIGGNKIRKNAVGLKCSSFYLKPKKERNKQNIYILPVKKVFTQI